MKYWLTLLSIALFPFFVHAASPEDSVRIKKINEEAQQLFRLGKMGQAVTTYEVHKQECKKLEMWEEYANGTRNQVKCYLRIGELDKMETTLRESFAILTSHLATDSIRFAEYYYDLSILKCERRKSNEAIPLLANSIRIFTKFDPQHKQIAGCYNVLGVCYRDKGDFELSLNYHQHAIQSVPDGPRKKIILSKYYNNIGIVYVALKEYEKALAYYSKSLTIKKEIYPPLHHSLSATYGNISAIYSQLEDYPKAISYLEKGLEVDILNFGADSYMAADKYATMGSNYFRMNEVDHSLKLVEKAIPIFREKLGPHHAKLGRVISQKADIFAEKGEWDLALTFYQKGLEVVCPGFISHDPYEIPNIEILGNHEDVVAILRKKAKFLQKRFSETEDKKMIEFSLKCYEKAIEVYAQLKEDLKAERSKLLILEGERETFEEAIEICFLLWKESHDPTHIEKAFSFSEQSKASILRSSIQADRAINYSGLPQYFLIKERALKKKVSSCANTLFEWQQKTDVNPDTLLFWKGKVFHANIAYQSLIDEMEKSYPEYYQLKHARQVIGLKEVKKYVENNSTQLLSYFYGNDHLYAFWISPNGCQWHRTNPKGGLDAALDSLTQQLSDHKRIMQEGNSRKLFAEFTQNASLLYDELVRPFELNPNLSLMIEPDGKLHFLPFDLLLTGAIAPGEEINYGKLPYLVKRFSIQTIYSGALMFQPVNKPKKRVARMAAFAPSCLAANENVFLNVSQGRGEEINFHQKTFAELPYTGVEVQAFDNEIGGDVFMGKTATEALFRKTAGTYNILHLAMHAFTNEANPMYSGMVFQHQNPQGDSLENNENDGILYAYELYELPLHADLVTLSACNTGHGKLARGEGVMSLARAFRHAGCPNIIMSLWQCDDESTSRLMQYFYKALKKDRRPADALREAKLAYLSDNHKVYPHFWGAFVYLGESAQLEMPTHHSWTWGGIILGVLVLLGAWMWGKKNWT